LGAEAVARAREQERRAIVLALAAAEDPPSTLEVHVLEAYRQALEEAEAAAVEKLVNRRTPGSSGSRRKTSRGRARRADAPGGARAPVLATRHEEVEDAPVEEQDGGARERSTRAWRELCRERAQKVAGRLRAVAAVENGIRHPLPIPGNKGIGSAVIRQRRVSWAGVGGFDSVDITAMLGGQTRTQIRPYRTGATARP
jgi:hypothetical protein